MQHAKLTQLEDDARELYKLTKQRVEAVRALIDPETDRERILAEAFLERTHWVSESAYNVKNLACDLAKQHEFDAGSGEDH